MTDTEFLQPAWPPTNWKDTFVAPRDHVKCMKNALYASCTTKDIFSDPVQLEEALAHVMEHEKVDRQAAIELLGKSADRTPVLLFAMDSKKANLKKWKETDWVLTALPNNPGLAKQMYIHRSTADVIGAVRAMFGTVGLVFHPVPCDAVKNLWTITEIYLMPGSTILVEELSTCTTSCLYCKQKTESICELCGNVFLCTDMCAHMAMQTGLHSTAECMQMTKKLIADDIGQAREKLRIKNSSDVKDEIAPTRATD